MANQYNFTQDKDTLQQYISSIPNKVDKVNGKGLSTNDYTTTEKTKLSGIESGAQKNAANTVIDANYVHTDNNYTTADKTQLSELAQKVGGIETLLAAI